MCHQDLLVPQGIWGQRGWKSLAGGLLQNWGYDWEIRAGAGKESECCLLDSLDSVGSQEPLLQLVAGTKR